MMSVWGRRHGRLRVHSVELAPHGIRVNHIGPDWVLSRSTTLPALATEEITRTNPA
jgi:NAD(P)-dependent dehydrogenase (short-subunit alcohol dehydrogenase family)